MKGFRCRFTSKAAALAGVYGRPHAKAKQNRIFRVYGNFIVKGYFVTNTALQQLAEIPLFVVGYINHAATKPD